MMSANAIKKNASKIFYFFVGKNYFRQSSTLFHGQHQIFTDRNEETNKHFFQHGNKNLKGRIILSVLKQGNKN